MDILIYLIPIALFMGGIGLTAFIWSLKSGQFDDLEGEAARILFDDDELEVQAKDKAALEKSQNEAKASARK